jgi:LacI family transcriptional regulator
MATPGEDGRSGRLGRREAGAPTLKDVARAAGVSAMTASRVLHGQPGVSPAARDAVLQAVKTLGYRRNELARNLRLGRTSGLIGLVVTNLANPFYSQMALGVEAVAEEAGFRVVLTNTGEDAQRERRLVDELVARRVDGIIVVPAGADHAHLSEQHLGRIPVVLSARPPSNIAADCVLVDDFGGAREATIALAATGVRRIGFLGMPAATWTGSERYRGFCVALDEAGLVLDERYVRRNQRTVAAAEAAALELLGLVEPPEAIFCANNRNTIGAFRAVSRSGQVVRLAGFDDFELADMLGLPLIVVAYDPADLGREAALLLLDRLNRGEAAALDAPRRVVIPTRVVQYGQSVPGAVGVINGSSPTKP